MEIPSSVVSAATAVTDGRSAEEVARRNLVGGWQGQAVLKAVVTGDWFEVVEAFGEELGASRLGFVGMLRSREGRQATMSVLAGTRADDLSGLAEALAANGADIGQSLFSNPISLGDRQVEFYDIDLTTGALANDARAPIALFSPFYMDGWTERSSQPLRRRTIMFANVVATRYEVCTVPHARKASPPSRPAEELSPRDVRRAVAAWLTLHEMFHAAGPAPFFSAASQKRHLGKEYGFAEEARVDMTTFAAAQTILGPEAGDGMRRVLLDERLYRSARAGARAWLKAEKIGLDGTHGLLWLAIVCDGRSGSLEDGRLHFEMDAALEAVNGFLASVYENEFKAISQRSETRRILGEFGAALTSRCWAWLDANREQLARFAGWDEQPPPELGLGQLGIGGIA